MSEGRSWYPFAGETRTFPPLGLRPSILAREAGITVKVEPASTSAFGVATMKLLGVGRIATHDHAFRGVKEIQVVDTIPAR